MKIKVCRCFLGLVVTLLCLPRVVFSAGVVNSPDDAALRAALAGGGTVTFNCEGTIVLTGTLAVASSTVINATGHAITISGGNAVQLFSISPGVIASFINLTLAKGYAMGSNGMADPPVTNGQPGMGGAIFNNGGTVALTSCNVVSNNATGGAGSNSGGGDGLGGAIYNLAGTLAITNCSFIINGATGGAGNGGSYPSGGNNGGDAFGGAIYSLNGSMVVENSSFALHTSQGGKSGYYDGAGQCGNASGGAVCSVGATVNFYHSTFTGNFAGGTNYGVAGSGMGGAIFATNGAVNCIGCTFENNTVNKTNTVNSGIGLFYLLHGVAQGGAIWSQAPLSVSQSAFFCNRAWGAGNGTLSSRAGEGSGGAIYSGGTLSLSGSTFATNAVRGGDGGLAVSAYNCAGGAGRGGAVCSVGTFLAATNCTFVANFATGGAGGNVSRDAVSGGDGAGGGLNINIGTATLVNLTFASNSATGGAGGGGGPAGSSSGGATCNAGGTVTLYNTIVASSISGSNCWGTLLDSGYNLSSDSSAGFYAPGSLNNTDPILGPLGNYGGFTLTLPLLAGSPAIDGGNTATAPATDQRGHARPYGGAADIGAFESSPPFFIGGQVSGHTLKDEVTIVIGSSNLGTTNLGTYGVSAFAAGPYTVTPTSPNYLFIPASRPVTVGPDQFGINFNAYHWNALSLEAVTNGMLDCIIADTNGQTCRVLTSTDLHQWLPISTNNVGSSNYFEAFLPLTGEPSRYYRTAIP